MSSIVASLKPLFWATLLFSMLCLGRFGNGKSVLGPVDLGKGFLRWFTYFMGTRVRFSEFCNGQLFG